VFDEIEALALESGDQAFCVAAVGFGETELRLLAIDGSGSDDGVYFHPNLDFRNRLRL
jgi:hypothetical protein